LGYALYFNKDYLVSSDYRVIKLLMRDQPARRNSIPGQLKKHSGFIIEMDIEGKDKINIIYTPKLIDI
jgi:hypothetical protein